MPLGANKAAIMGVAGISADVHTLILSTTASDAASIEFTSGFDSTYREYVFGFYLIHPETDGTSFSFQTSTNGGSSYGIALTFGYMNAYHKEDDSAAALGVDTGFSSTTNYGDFARSVGSDNDQCVVGKMHFHLPSNTTFVKQFYIETDLYAVTDYNQHVFNAGDVGTTTAINAISFKMATGNMNGTIKFWGVS